MGNWAKGTLQVALWIGIREGRTFERNLRRRDPSEAQDSAFFEQVQHGLGSSLSRNFLAIRAPVVDLASRKEQHIVERSCTGETRLLVYVCCLSLVALLRAVPRSRLPATTSIDSRPSSSRPSFRLSLEY